MPSFSSSYTGSGRDRSFTVIICRCAALTLFRVRRTEGEWAQRLREGAQVGARRKRRQNVMMLWGVGRKRSTGCRAPRERRPRLLSD
jgi:hypothetical protein